MNDKEFSPAPAEFSPPRPEFSAPPREWAAPGNEISRDDTAPPQKKRRSLPAMLVAGVLLSPCDSRFLWPFSLTIARI